LAETISIDDNLTLDEKYQALLPQIKSLLTVEDKLISNLANLTAVLKQTFEKISWVGFYFSDGDKLYLGPFQGKVACTSIEFGKGVCGKAAADRKSIVVPDVNKFPGHIFCDPASKSEIVIPVMKGDKLFSVLDLDSNQYNSFNETDEKYLNEICKFLSAEILIKES
jgi:GAF domain-containing protein